MQTTTSDKTIGRISLYRRLLHSFCADGVRYLYSHQLATLAGVTPAQVRRDIMALGYVGSPARGYHVEELLESISAFLNDADVQPVALVGLGNLGRALLAYLGGRSSKYSVVAAFDSDPQKAGRVINGCRCYPVDSIREVLEDRDIHMAILAVPAEAAQETAARLCELGVTGILNFAPVRLWVPDHVYVEDIDLTTALERVAYHARRRATMKEGVR
ncbi:MAG: redox-sensing transcriptional repressor Rex [Candidatus Hydrogenedentes bacterium]|nr:redox-sensing transcriptional repressor Rex [Candidatus Hydrogenedentota bacterium]